MSSGPGRVPSDPPVDGSRRVSTVLARLSSDPPLRSPGSGGHAILSNVAQMLSGQGSGGHVFSDHHVRGAGPGSSASSMLQTFRSLYPDSKVELA